MTNIEMSGAGVLHRWLSRWPPGQWPSCGPVFGENPRGRAPKAAPVERHLPRQGCYTSVRTEEDKVEDVLTSPCVCWWLVLLDNHA